MKLDPLDPFNVIAPLSDDVRVSTALVGRLVTLDPDGEQFHLTRSDERPFGAIAGVVGDEVRVPMVSGVYRDPRARKPPRGEGKPL